MDLKKTEKVSYHSSPELIKEISNRRVMANTFFVAGNIRNAFKALICMKQSIIQSITIKERINLKEIEKKFDKCSSALGAPTFNKDINEMRTIAYNIVQRLYSEYNDLLMDILEDRGYLVPLEIQEGEWD